MKKILSILALSLMATMAQAYAAGELDNEDSVKNAQRFAAELPQTLVVRVDESGAVSVMHSKKKIESGKELSFDANKFMPINKDEPNELDKDSSSSGWYFWWNYNYSYNYGFYGFPNYYYQGYNYYYQPYYWYYSAYDNCKYYYYGWNSRAWRRW